MAFIFIVLIIITIVGAIINAPKNKKLKIEIENELAIINRELENNPNDSLLIARKAVQFAMLGDKNKADRFLEEALLRTPNSGLLYYSRAFIIVSPEENLSRKAYSYFIKAVELGGLNDDELQYAYFMIGKMAHQYNELGNLHYLSKSRKMGSKAAANYMDKYRLRD